VEARTAVQKQIERMFSNATTGAANVGVDKAAKDAEASRNASNKAESPASRFGPTSAGSSLLTNPHNGTKISGSR
jgi:hypothetical protein